MELKQGYRLTEIGSIPSDWDVVAIGSVAEFSGGSQPPRSVFKYSESDGFIRLIQIRDYKSDDFLTYVPRHLARKFCSADDIMIGRYGPPIFQILRGIEGAYNVALIKTTPNENILKSYLYLVLKQEKLFNLIEAMSRRTSGQTGVEMPALKGYLFPLPPKHEQRAIASCLSDVDALIAGLEKLIAKKRDLKQAAMQQLLTGQTRLPGFSAEWVHKQLGDVMCEISDGGTPSTSDSRNFGGNVPWVVIDDIQQKIAITRTMLTKKGLQACAARRWPQGTLVVSTGATIGEVGILQVSAATKQGICGMTLDPLLATTEYMYYWFLNNKKLLLSKAQGSSIKEVRAPTLVTLPLLIPDIDEQNAVASVLSEIDSEMTTLETRVAKTRDLKQGMMQELLTGRTRLV